MDEDKKHRFTPELIFELVRWANREALNDKRFHHKFVDVTDEFQQRYMELAKFCNKILDQPELARSLQPPLRGKDVYSIIWKPEDKNWTPWEITDEKWIRISLWIADSLNRRFGFTTEKPIQTTLAAWKGLIETGR